MRSLAFAGWLSISALAQGGPLRRSGQTIVIEPYAPNVVRITLSLIEREAVAAPGYGIVASAQPSGWSHTVDATGADSYTSRRMSVSVAPEHKRGPHDKLPDTANFFSGSTAGVDIRITLPDGAVVTEMSGWQMAELNQKDDTLKNARGILPQDLPLYTVGATFTAADDERFYGLGENQEGNLDRRQRPVVCPANYLAAAAPS